RSAPRPGRPPRPRSHATSPAGSPCGDPATTPGLLGRQLLVDEADVDAAAGPDVPRDVVQQRAAHDQAGEPGRDPPEVGAVPCMTSAGYWVETTASATKMAMD